MINQIRNSKVDSHIIRDRVLYLLDYIVESADSVEIINNYKLIIADVMNFLFNEKVIISDKMLKRSIGTLGIRYMGFLMIIKNRTNSSNIL